MLYTKIQWTDATINFWTGCKKVSEGCKFCYMYRNKERYGQIPSTVLKVNRSTILGALKKLKVPSKIFTCSWSDFFIEEADDWRDEAWQIIKEHPQHQWQILTKRPERIARCLPSDWGEGWNNVWIGISAENQTRYDERIEVLLSIPAKTRFISVEPLLDSIDMRLDEFSEKLHWVIIGGESGNDIGKYLYRPCRVEWIEDLVDQGTSKNLPVFVKQLGTHLYKELRLSDRHGGSLEDWPKRLQVRQFPHY